jgi:hypothetical protein
MRARVQASTAAEMSSISSTRDKPYCSDEPPRPSPCETSMTGTPARSRAPATVRTCSTVNWWRIGWEPSRRLLSVRRGRGAVMAGQVAARPAARCWPTRQAAAVMMSRLPA